jgi:RNA polymerase sigma factor (sigma-70 family)
MKSINKEELHEIFDKLKDEKKEFEKLYEQYGNLVYKIAFSIVKNREQSEDIKQIVFLKIWKIEKDKVPARNEASWLYSITKNETLNYIKKQKDTISLDDIYYITVEDKELNKIIDKESYNKILDRLESKEQEIISLKILGNLSFQEIAQMLDEPVGTIKWKYYKSIHTLKILLSNLSMLIVTLLVGLKTMFNTNKSEQPSIAEQEKNITEDSTTKQAEKTKTETESQDRSENNIIAEDSTKEETKEEIIIPKSQEINYVGVGILSISGIFLIVTLIFTIFFVKYQLKAKKKLSK